jgi:hypothetical protein
MVAYGLQADEERVGDLLIASAVRDQRQDLALALSQFG